MTRRFDAIVVGSGAAGGWAAKELTEAGLSVLLLEAGRDVEPGTDYPMPPPAEHRLLSRVQAVLRGQSVQMRCGNYNARTRHFFVNDRDNPYSTAPGKPFSWFRGRQLGGRMHTWSRVVCRLSDWELNCASRDGYGLDWPLSAEELAPCYERVERFLGVYGTVEELSELPDCVYAGPSRLTEAEARFKDVVERCHPDRRVIPIRTVGHDLTRTPSTIERARATGRLTVETDAIVRSIEVDPKTGKATGVRLVEARSNRARTVDAASIVLCASTIETLRILLNSTSASHPRGFGNSSGLLGSHFMDHVMSGLGGPLPNPSGAEQVGSAAADPYDFAHPCGFYIPRFRNTTDRHDAFLRGYAILGGIGRAGANWFFLAHGEMLPRPENRVRLDPHRTDRWGIPIAEIDCEFSQNEHAMARDQIEVMRELAHAAGLPVHWPPSGGRLEALAFRLWRRKLLAPDGSFVPGTAIHELGGARMGEDPRSSVLDPFGRCWDANNVFVTDGSVFPSGCSQNVTLTIMALTVRSCRELIARHRAGALE